MSKKFDSTVFMVCKDEEIAKAAGETFARVSAALSAVHVYMDKMADLDEDSPDLESQADHILVRLTSTLVQLYPKGPGQMEADIKSIGNFTVRTNLESEK